MTDFIYTVWYDVPEPGARGSGQGFRQPDARKHAVDFWMAKRAEGYKHAWIEDHEAARAKLVCLDGPEGCRGPVDWRAVDGLKAWPRCEAHLTERLKLQERINHRYGSIAPPRDFDPSYAGESWDEDY